MIPLVTASEPGKAHPESIFFIELWGLTVSVDVTEK